MDWIDTPTTPLCRPKFDPLGNAQHNHLEKTMLEATLPPGWVPPPLEILQRTVVSVDSEVSPE